MKHPQILWGLFLIVLTLAIGSAEATVLFSDDFNDTTLEGWTIQQGDWYPTGSTLMGSSDNYGIILADKDLGPDQHIAVDALFDAQTGSNSKWANLRARNGMGEGGNIAWDHGYLASVSRGVARIQSNIQRGVQHLLKTEAIDLDEGWHRLEFEVTGSEKDTWLKLWIDSELIISVNDSAGTQSVGLTGLGSSNHINRRIEYDNYVVTPEPASCGLIALGGVMLVKRRRK